LALDDPGVPATVAPDSLDSFYFTLPPRRRRFQHRWWVHILLFVITVGTTALVGTEYYLSFLSAFGTASVTIHPGALVLKGLIFSAAILGILGAHEMGHYVACRIYNVDATLPSFLPFPLLSISGTLGAVIKIREPFPTRRALFDIGIAGPIAGFVVLVPVLVLAVAQSTVVRAPDPTTGFQFGEPLLFHALVWLRFGHIGPGYQLNLHPIGFGAWFGMLATAWNLLPFGQLDGGHITFATLGTRARYISIITVAASIVMCFVSGSWIVMTLMMVAMLYFLGPGHPPVMNDYEPLGRERQWVAVFAIVMFVLCFTPVPLELIGR
jgi:membrane-associated protease RseP (regulator of RpoE activity)